MLLHGPEDRDVFFVQKGDYSVNAVKEFIGSDRAQGGQKKGDFLSILSFFQALSGRCLWIWWAGIAVWKLQDRSPLS